MSPRFQIFGIPMETRTRRRQLVVAVYVFLGALCVLNVFTITRSQALTPYVQWAAVLVGALIFGGTGRIGNRSGLLKPFSNKPPRPESPQIEMVRIRLNPQSVAPEDTSWQNDERELARRDNAHYRAYQYMILGPILIMTLIGASFGLSGHSLLRLVSEPMLRQIAFTVAEVTSILMLTLPSAIILWTEPDILTDDPDPAAELSHAGRVA